MTEAVAPGRRRGHPAAPAHGRHAEADAADRRGAVPAPLLSRRGRPASTTWCSPRRTGRRCSARASVTAPRSACASTTSPRSSRSAPAAASATSRRLLESGPDDPVVILNGDILVRPRHGAGRWPPIGASGADVSLHLTEVEDARAFGCVPTDDSGRVTAFLEKMPNPVTNRINAGCYVFRRSVDRRDPGRPAGVGGARDVPRAGGRRRAGARATSTRRTGSTSARRPPSSAGRATWCSGSCVSPALPGPTGERLLLPGAEVADDAVVAGGTTVGAGARVSAGATVEGSVLLDGAVVGAGAVVRGSVVGRDATVGPGAALDGVVVGDGAVRRRGQRAGARCARLGRRAHPAVRHQVQPRPAPVRLTRRSAPGSRRPGTAR